MNEGGWSLDRYLVEIRNKSFILENEDDILEAGRDGDNRARERLVESYLAITAEIALRLAPAALTPLQAVEEANLVLLRLIERGASKPVVELGPAIDKHFATLA